MIAELFTTTGLIGRDLSPEDRFLGFLLNRAARDAAAGNLEALAWLVYAGVDIAKSIHPASAEWRVLLFCEMVLASVDRGELAGVWGPLMRETPAGGWEIVTKSYNKEGSSDEPRE